MCFAPERRALFRHLNFQKWSEPLVLLTFWLGNVFRATTACTFSTSQLPKVVRPWCVLYILPWKCASRHNGVQFFISHLASWLRTRRFSEPTFRPSGAPNHWKNKVFRDFPTFSRICIFFLLTLSLLIFSLLIFLFSLPLPCSAFHLSILSEVWLLNFLRSFRIPKWQRFYRNLPPFHGECSPRPPIPSLPRNPAGHRPPKICHWGCRQLPPSGSPHFGFEKLLTDLGDFLRWLFEWLLGCEKHHWPQKSHQKYLCQNHSDMTKNMQNSD